MIAAILVPIEALEIDGGGAEENAAGKGLISLRRVSCASVGGTVIGVICGGTAEEEGGGVGFADGGGVGVLVELPREGKEGGGRGVYGLGKGRRGTTGEDETGAAVDACACAVWLVK